MVVPMHYLFCDWRAIRDPGKCVRVHPFSMPRGLPIAELRECPHLFRAHSFIAIIGIVLVVHISEWKA